MAVTIDHLRVDHHITVLQSFTDVAGTHVTAGDTGILRAQGVDYARKEFWIELERGASRDRLRFADRATDGPRIGRMREYFEMGDEVVGEPAETSTTAKGPFLPPKVVEAPQRQAFAGRQPPHDTNIDQLTVACDCDPMFHRALLSAISEYSVHACLRCGTITCTRTLGDDGRFTGDAWYVHRTIGLSDRSLAWLDRLPRIKVDHAAGRLLWPMSAAWARYPTLYYPADTRCRTRDELEELESSLAREQSGRTVAECLRATSRINDAPPADLSPSLPGYEYLWQALQLRATTDVRQLMRHARSGTLGCPLAVDLLLRRPDAYDVMIAALKSDDSAERDAGFSMARDMRPPDARLADELAAMLSELPIEASSTAPGQVNRHGRFEMIFLLAAESGVSSPNLLATLRAVMRKLARHDASLVDYVRIAIRALDAPVSR